MLHAFLPPIYVTTRKLLKHMCGDLRDLELRNALWTEEDSLVVAALEAEYSAQPFDILFADHVGSRSGRISPVSAVVEWCRSRSVISVIDGTQTADLDMDKWPDYYMGSARCPTRILALESRGVN